MFHALEVSANVCIDSADVKLFQNDDAEPERPCLPVACA
jgi:hypothetical protein